MDIAEKAIAKPKEYHFYQFSASDEMFDLSEQEPRLRVEVLSQLKGDRSGEWKISWQLTNETSKEVRVLEIWLPHNLFFAHRLPFAEPLSLGPAGTADVQLPVICSQPPGSVVENAFMILRVWWSEDHWRIFVRLKIAVSSDGTPFPTREAISTLRVGFSESSLARRASRKTAAAE